VNDKEIWWGGFLKLENCRIGDEAERVLFGKNIAENC
jgi:hypothetical protein